MINYVVAAGVGFITIAGEFDIASIPSKPWFYMALVIGVMLIVAFHLFGLSAQYAGVTITAISSRMSVIIPVMLGGLVFDAEVNALKITGVLIAMVAFWLTFKKNRSVAVTKKYLYLPLILLVAVGITHSLMKYAEHFFIGDEFELFLATAFSVSLILGIIVHIIRSPKTGLHFKFRNILGGIILGSVNWCATFYFLKGLDTYDISIFVPLFNVSVVILSTLIGFFIFKERMRTVNWVGVLIAVVAIIMLAFA